MKSEIEFLYEELRKATDGGSESMTHDDALKQIAYWRGAQQVAVPSGYVLVDGAVIEYLKAHWHLRTDWETCYYTAMQIEKLKETQPPQGDKP